MQFIKSCAYLIQILISIFTLYSHVLYRFLYKMHTHTKKKEANKVYTEVNFGH